MKKNIKFFIDDKPVIAKKDQTIWQVAKDNGTELPHLSLF